MQAILAEHFGGAEVMRAGELRMPEPAPDEVLVRAMAAGVGPWDVEQRRSGPGSLTGLCGNSGSGTARSELTDVLMRARASAVTLAL